MNLGQLLAIWLFSLLLPTKIITAQVNCDSLHVRDQRFYLRDYSFTDDGEIVAINSNGFLMRSYDGHSRWEVYNVKAAEGEGASSICFTGNNTGYITQQKEVLKTVDGGYTWFSLRLVPHYTDYVTGSCFLNDVLGYVSTSSNGLLITRNGGESFETIFPEKYTGTSISLGLVHFYDTLHGVVAGGTYSNTIYSTHDAGKTWHKSIIADVNYSGAFYDIKMADAQTIYATTEYGTFVKSINGGASWAVTKNAIIPKSRLDISSSDSILAFPDEPGWSYYYSTDEGNTWQNHYDTIKMFGFVKRNPVDNKIYNIVRSHYDENFRVFTGNQFGSNWSEDCLLGHPGSVQHFISATKAFAVVNNELYQSNDRGISWKKKSKLPVNPWLGTAREIVAKDENRILVLNDSVIATEDGGQNWRLMNMPFPMYQSSYTKVEFYGSETFFVNDIMGLIKGNITTGEMKRVVDIEGGVMDFKMLNSGVGYATAHYNELLKTTDYGEHWTLIKTWDEKGLNDVFFINDLTGFVSTNGQEFYRTADGGLTWETQSNAYINNSRRTFHFTDSLNGILLAGYNTFQYYKTADAGKTWVFQRAMGLSSEYIKKVFQYDSLLILSDELWRFVRFDQRITAGYIYGPQTTCTGETITLQTPSIKTASKYQWLLSGPGTIGNGTVSNAVKWSSAGIYAVNLEVTGPCNQTTTKTFYVTVKDFVPQIAADSITIKADSAVTYQWVINGSTISNEPDSFARTIIPAVSGVYQAILQNELGCFRLSNEVKFVISKYYCLGKPALLFSGDSYFYSMQWQVDKGNGYEDIGLLDPKYVGANAAYLRINTVTRDLVGHKYRCVAKESDGHTYYLAEQILKIGYSWVGGNGTNWENPVNWSCGTIPTADSYVVINSGVVTVNSNVTVKGLQLSSGVSFTVMPGYTFTIKP